MTAALVTGFLGVLGVLIGVGVANGWQYRAQLREAYADWFATTRDLLHRKRAEHAGRPEQEVLIEQGILPARIATQRLLLLERREEARAKINDISNPFLHYPPSKRAPDEPKILLDPAERLIALDQFEKLVIRRFTINWWTESPD